MNQHRYKDGIMIHKYTKPHYSLISLYERSKRGTKAYGVLRAWYTGEYGEYTCVNKLKKLGLIHEDTFTETEFSDNQIIKTMKRTYRRMA